MGMMSFAAFRAHPGKDAELLGVIAERLPLLRRLGLSTDREHIVVRTPSGIIMEVSEWVSERAIEAAHQTPEVLALWKRYDACSTYVPPNESGEFAGMFPTFRAVVAKPGVRLVAWADIESAEKGGVRARGSSKKQTASKERGTRSDPAIDELAEQVFRRRAIEEAWHAAEASVAGGGFELRRFAARRSASALLVGKSAETKEAAIRFARGIGADLYAIDLSSSVSKYIGETEKNLRVAFEAAAGAGAVLLFDEADALFGKRTDVKDSHDRYANIEVSYLLQQIESSGVVVVLSSSRRDNIDPAFIRRLDFVLEVGAGRRK